MKIDKELRDKLVGIAASMQDDQGLELIDPQPKFVEIGPKRLSLADQIQRVLRKEVLRYAEHASLESPEDADDFDILDEDPLPLSGFEHVEMVEEMPEAVSDLDVALEAIEEADVPAVEEPASDPT